MKRVFAFLLCIAMLLSLAPMALAADRTPTREEAVQWLYSHEGQWHDLDGAYGAQCSDFVSAYMNWLYSGEIQPYQGYGVYMAYTYATGAASWNTNRWAVFSNTSSFAPEPGDIYVQGGNPGHVGVFLSGTKYSATVIDQNSWETKTQAKQYGDTGRAARIYTTSIANSESFIRYKHFASDVYTGSEMTSGAGKTLPDGDYEIVNATDPTFQLDISGNTVPAANETNVNIWKRDSTPREPDIFTVTYLDNGFYSIKQKGTNMSLDVYSSNCTEGTNVQMFKSTGNSNQQWSISRTQINGVDKAYRIQAKCSGCSLDINGGMSANDGKFINGQNVQMWRSNNTDAQGWLFIPYKPAQPITNGRYILLTGANTNYELDVKGDSSSASSGTNVQIYKDVDTVSRYNSFDFAKQSNGYYKITHAASGLALGVSGGGSVFNQNVAVLTSSGADTQLWAVTQYGSGYVLRVRSSGYTLDMENLENPANGTNVSQYPFHGKNNQIWKIIQAEHTVTYNANGGSGAPSAQTKYYKNALTLSSTKPTRSGYTFQGWAASSGATSASYQPGASYTSDANLTLYAVWKPVEITVTLNPNGGSVSPTSIKVTYGSTYANLPTPTRKGYTFAGWYTAASGGSKVTSSTKVTATSNHTLYAHWTVSTYTNSVNHWAVGFKNGEGNNGSKNAFALGQTSWRGEFGTSQTYSADMAKSVRGFTASSGLGTPSFDDDWTSYTIPYTFTQPDKNTFAEYYYDPISYKITYNLNGGTNNASNPATYNVLYGVTFAAPTKAGYTFNGWTDENGKAITGINEGANASFASVDAFYDAVNSRTIGDRTITAQWTANTCTVTFDANGGEVSEQSKTVAVGSTYGDLPTPTRKGYRFDGWYTAASGGSKVTSSTKVTATANHTLYAHWTNTTGDVNGDGEINGKDVTFLRRYFAGGYDIVILDASIADVNKDGIVSGKDVTCIRRYLAGGYGVTLE